MKSGQMLEASTHPFSTYVRGVDTMSHSIPNPTEQPNIPIGYCQCGCGRKTNVAKANQPRRGHIKGQPVRYVMGHGERTCRASVDDLLVPDGAVALPLARGKHTVIDAVDFEWLSQWYWYCDNGYVVRKETKEGKLCKVYMHRQIAGASKSQVIDHKNGDKADNRRSNLRICSLSENARNRGPQSNNTSGYKGVYRYNQSGKWQARIKLHGKVRLLGAYDTPEEAARVYDAAAREVFGEFARLNFPEDEK